MDNSTLGNVVWIYLTMNLENPKKNLGAMIYALAFGLCSWVRLLIMARTSAVFNVSHVYHLKISRNYILKKQMKWVKLTYLLFNLIYQKYYDFYI